MMTRAAPGIPSSFIRVLMYVSTASKSVRLSCAKDRLPPNATERSIRIIPLRKAIFRNIPLLLRCLTDLLNHLYDCRHCSVRLFDLNIVVAVFRKQLETVG